ncbi:hypothetical protein NHH03_05865 [Stieleria sp. TO1_6]|nr:hypothetical protein [Stieleria tagensis]MCO8121256.1 hypothetical protein [Stieleria tagensis]
MNDQQRVFDQTEFNVSVIDGLPYAQGMNDQPTDPERCFSRHLTFGYSSA